jgi:hypothetical protein
MLHGMERKDCSCPAEQLCQRCYHRDRLALLAMADVAGQCLAERLCRGELRAAPQWPSTAEAMAIAADHVAHLTGDPKLRAELAAACSAGAAKWWHRRPARYRL